MMVRYALTVNAELDASAIIVGDPITDPDELTVLGGTPGGFPTTPCNFTVGVPVASDVNPFVLGFFDTDATGTGTIDCVPVSTASDPTWWRNFDEPLPAGVEDSIPFGPNTGLDGVDLSIPSYNYLVVVQGEGTTTDPVPTGPHVMRWQVGNDIDQSVAGINNGIAPLPSQAFTKGELLNSPCCAGRASELAFNFGGLSELSGSVYQVWLFNEETDAFLSPSGDWVATEGVDTVASASGTRTFNSQKTWTHTFRTSDALAGQPVGEYTHVFLSIESAEAAAASARQPLWAQYTDMAGSPQDPFDWSFISPANMSFGTFGSGDPTPWSPSGLGQGGFWGETLGETDRLIVELRNLPIPPRGYYYEGWLVSEGGTEVHAGDLTAPFDEGFASLRDVDEDQSLSQHVRSDLIIRAVTRAFEENLGAGVNLEDFDEYRLVLSPKARTAVRPPTTALGGLMPDPLRDRRD
jgi:hypothetical protein